MEMRETMRVALVIMAFAGCTEHGEGGDAHTLTTCAEGAWEVNGEPITHCQVACAAGPAVPVDIDGDNGDDRCALCVVGFYVEFGVGGCCKVRDPADLGTPNAILDFTECP
jgi:hypothetical protein